MNFWKYEFSEKHEIYQFLNMNLVRNMRFIHFKCEISERANGPTVLVIPIIFKNILFNICKIDIYLFKFCNVRPIFKKLLGFE